MTARIDKDALNLRELLAQVRGLQSRVAPPLVRLDFANMLTNGGFDAGLAGWTNSSTGSGSVNTSGGTAVLTTNGPSDRAVLDQSFATVAGVTYTIRATMSGASASTAALWVGTSQGGSQLAAANNLGNGTITLKFTATGATTWIRIYGVYAAGAITADNVSIWGVDTADDAPWLRLPYGHKVGRPGMIVRDGLVLHPSDYTEINRLGQTFIKPLVAPGHDTEFSIWAEASA